MQNASTAVDPLPHSLRSDVVYRVDCKGCNAYYVRETRKTLKRRIREQEGAVRERETTSLIWMHTAETGHNFDFEGENLMKETLHSDHKQLFGASRSRNNTQRPR